MHRQRGALACAGEQVTQKVFFEKGFLLIYVMSGRRTDLNLA